MVSLSYQTSNAYILPLFILLQSPSSPTTATRRQRLVRTNSQKKCSAAKAAETRARNKAAKAAQGGQGSSAVQPNEPPAINHTAPNIPLTRSGPTGSGNTDSSFGAYNTL